MGCNVGGLDRKLRILVGVVILLIGMGMSSWWALVGLIPLITGIMGWCPAYLLFGASTCKTDSDKSAE